MITLQHGWLHGNADNCSCHEFPILLTIVQTEYTTMGEPFLLSSAYLTSFLETTRFLWLSHVITVHKAQPGNKLCTIFAMVIRTIYSNSLSTVSASSSKVIEANVRFLNKKPQLIPHMPNSCFHCWYLLLDLILQAFLLVSLSLIDTKPYLNPSPSDSLPPPNRYRWLLFRTV